MSRLSKFPKEESSKMYFKDLVSSVTVYESQLRGFERIHLKIGATKKSFLCIKT
ncbi:MAG: fibronectin type III-like domain-contianing protein [Chitinophagia bacterium]